MRERTKRFIDVGLGAVVLGILGVAAIQPMTPGPSRRAPFAPSRVPSEPTPKKNPTNQPSNTQYDEAFVQYHTARRWIKTAQEGIEVYQDSEKKYTELGTLNHEQFLQTVGVSNLDFALDSLFIGPLDRAQDALESAYVALERLSRVPIPETYQEGIRQSQGAIEGAIEELTIARATLTARTELSQQTSVHHLEAVHDLYKATSYITPLGTFLDEHKSYGD